MVFESIKEDLSIIRKKVYNECLNNDEECNEYMNKEYNKEEINKLFEEIIYKLVISNGINKEDL